MFSSLSSYVMSLNILVTDDIDPEGVQLLVAEPELRVDEVPTLPKQELLSRIERKELQTLLQQRGYPIGNIDGVLGAKTREAIADFQERAGLKRDGRAGQKVLQALKGR